MRFKLIENINDFRKEYKGYDGILVSAYNGPGYYQVHIWERFDPYESFVQIFTIESVINQLKEDIKEAEGYLAKNKETR